MTIQQTINIPADRRVHFDFDLPRDIPDGAAKFKLIITPFRAPRPEAVRMPPRSEALPPKPKNAPAGCNFWQDRVRPGDDPFAWHKYIGAFKDVGLSTDEFLAEKHAENEREEAKFDAMFNRKRERPE